MIDLPKKPAPADVTFAVIDYGRVITGSLGGADQRIDRAGTRFRMTVTMPPLNARRDAQAYISRLMRGKSEGCRLALPLGDFKPGNPGNPVLATDDPQGNTASMTGFAENYVISEGQFFSIESGGQHYLYTATAEVVAGGDGAAIVPVYPNIRAPYQAGDVCHFARPYIEGYVEDQELSWQMAVDHNIGIGFTIRERE